MSFKIRDYQQEDLNRIRQELLRHKNILYRLATGGGKTVTAGFMIKGALEKNKNIWFLCHRKELISQSSDTFRSMGIEHGLIVAGKPHNPYMKVHVAMVQTVGRRLDALSAPDIILFDEAHHINAGTWAKIYDRYPKAFKIGLTATPCRSDGKGLGEYFDTIVEGKETNILIQEGRLSPFKIFAPSIIDTSDIKSRAGDFKREELDELMDKSSLIGDIITNYLNIAGGKKGIVFASTVKHSKHIVSMFKAAGITAKHLDGTVDKADRSAVIKRFRNGIIQILSNVDLFGEGFDVPDTEVIIQARPTKSLGLYLQQCGRVFRPIYAEGMKIDTVDERHEAIRNSHKPYAIILDHAGNVFRHDKPDIKREWSLDGVKNQGRKKEESSISIKRCPDCFNIVSIHTNKCECGYIWKIKTKKIKIVEGELKEITEDINDKKELRQEQGRAKTIDDLIIIGRERGYKNPYAWAKHVIRSRNRK